MSKNWEMNYWVIDRPDRSVGHCGYLYHMANTRAGAKRYQLESGKRSVTVIYFAASKDNPEYDGKGEIE